MTKDEIFINDCIKLAQRGKGHTSPNPMVGCIIEKNYKILGKGYHKRYRDAHAEVNAIKNAKQNRHDLKGAVLYVNLEPCCHFGNTPPCTDLIIEEKFSEVIIGMTDPNELVNGNGIKKLEEAGIKVRFGILEDKCKELNKFYIKYVTEKLPYVTLKIAQSIDGKIALPNYDSKWISGKESKIFVHRLRSEYDSVLIGTNTTKYDDPELTVREVKGRNPMRFVIDKDFKLYKNNLKLFSDSSNANTFVITSKKKQAKKSHKGFSAIYIKEKRNRINLKTILKSIYKLNVSSVLVEGGGNLFSQFAETNLFDDLYLIVSPKIIGKGISSFNDFKINSLKKAKELFLIKKLTTDNDLILHYKNIKKS
jgi:diaminohydroxyphosphoribosylaminopyrimidine deaminase/5-amino-6-(5-phosphoribosylamino)uracil reductase